MKIATSLKMLVFTTAFGLVSPQIWAQSSASIIVTGIERITDTGVDAPSVSGAFGVSGNFRKYRREINLIGTINGVAAVPSTPSNSPKDYNTGLVDQSDATLSSSYRSIQGDRYSGYGNYVDMLGFTSTLNLNNVSGKLIIKESTYESQRLSNAAVFLVFPRSTQTYPINGEPYVILTPTPNPPGSARWINLSTRVFAGTGDNLLVVGFVVAGNIPKNFLVRVVGPSLGQFGLTGFMPDPKFSVIPQNSSTAVAQNDDWGGGLALSTTFTSVGAFGFSGPASKDAAAVVTLAPGAYSVTVNATAGNTGIALVEVYEVP